MSAFDALLGKKQKTTTTKTGGSAFDALLQNKPQVAVNKFGTDVTGHAYNPLNPKNQIKAPLPSTNTFDYFKKEFTPSGSIGKLAYGSQSLPATLIKQYTQPSEMTRQAEKAVPNVPVLHQTGQAILRTIIPLAEGFGVNVGSDIIAQREQANELNKKTTFQTVGKQVQSNVPSTLVTHKLTRDEVVNVALNTIPVGLLIAPFITKGVANASLKLSEVVSKESRVPITYSDLQKITTSANDLEAISRVGQEKYNAYREATRSNAVRQALKDGYVTLAEKQPTRFANILRNIATRPITEVANFTKNYGAKVNVPGVGLLPERISFTESKTLPPEVLSNYEPSVSNGTLEYTLKPSVEPQNAPEQAITPEPAQTTPTVTETPANTPGQTPSKIAKSVEQKAIEQKLTQGFEGLAGYDKITIKDQAEKATQLLSDPEKAMRVIKGEDPLPEGLRGTAVITAAEEHIRKTGDARMAYELANSPLVSETSTSAQELRLAAERQADSLTAKLQEIKKVREEAAKKKVGNLSKARKVIKTDIQKEIQAHAPEPKDWASFIDSIKCS